MLSERIGARTKLLVWLILPSIVLQAVMILLTQHNTADYLRDTQDTALRGMVAQSVKLMENQMNDLVLNVLGIEDDIKSEDRTPANLINTMEAVAHTRPEVIRGLVYVPNDEAIVGYPEYFWNSFGQKELAIIKAQTNRSQNEVVWSEPFRSTLASTGTNSLVSIVTKQLFDEDGTPRGVLAFVTDVMNLVERSAAFAGSYDTSTLLYDRQDALIYSMTIVAQNNLEMVSYQQQELKTLSSAEKHFERNHQYYVVSAMSQVPYWKVVVVGDVKKLEDNYRPVVRFAMIALMIGLIGLIGIYVGVSWWFTRPIMALTRGIRKVARGHLNHSFEVTRRDEFGEMAREINRMLRTIQELIASLEEKEQQKRKADFQALLSQINPHFLYNTLNTIDIMVDISSKPDIHRVMGVLIRLLKYGLDRTMDLRPLKQEINYVNDYLTIQSVRYEGQFHFSVDVPAEELGRIPVLKLVLQPLVENAVFHGLRPLTDRQGMLSVVSRREGEDLLIAIADNGVGMTEERIAQLMKGKLDEMDAEEQGAYHIGFRNVHERIQLYYGPGYGLQVQSWPGQGTTITVRLRIVQEGDANVGGTQAAAGR
ncbi:sensor histidine kinase [Paenibacillus sacheonensis]|uniref:histidine kinase n=1 Tax=Paenibacillus sacheonensis TaxID=742054 RepID=A0A7X5C4G1_9BACL|nr:histidine kinase [Paenibacillus sacheonensis]MBM7568523.1 sensor histidine kinase YesM [Paenibacillus sacheonensis]NBC72349.1 HAMP domain-containing protein [Paenibacillus sacheonensis]